MCDDDDYDDDNNNKHNFPVFKLSPCSKCSLFLFWCNSPASEFKLPTFRNSLSVPSS